MLNRGLIRILIGMLLFLTGIYLSICLSIYLFTYLSIFLYHLSLLRDNIHEYLPHNVTHSTKINHIQIQLDYIRINLLIKYGGVWIDYNVFCVQPLDSWLPSKLSYGFYAFSRYLNLLSNSLSNFTI